MPRVQPIQTYYKRIAHILDNLNIPKLLTQPLGAHQATSPPPPTSPADERKSFVTDFAWLLLGFFSQRTKVTAFLGPAVAAAVAQTLDAQVFRGSTAIPSRPTVSTVPYLTSALY